MFFRPKRLNLMWSLVACAFATTTPSVAEVSQQPQSMKLESSASSVSEDKIKLAPVDSRGKQLKEEITSIYKRLAETKAIKPDGQGINDITQYVIKYIPPGTSFDDAEQVLRAAGFILSARPSPDVTNKLPFNPDDYRFGVYASLELAKQLLGKTTVSLLLMPKSAGDYEVVNKLTAQIVKLTL